MAMRELPNVKTIQFDGKTQFEAHVEFVRWHRANQKKIVILGSAFEGPELDEPKYPYAIRVSYEVVE